MKVIRVFAGDDGQSHFEDVEIPLPDISTIGSLSKLITGQGVYFRFVGGDYDLDFHNAPRRQFVVNLKGSVEIEVGDGSKRIIDSGEILLAEDVSGQGHKSRAIGKRERWCLFIPIDDDFDFSTLE